MYLTLAAHIIAGIYTNDVIFRDEKLDFVHIRTFSLSVNGAHVLL